MRIVGTHLGLTAAALGCLVAASSLRAQPPQPAQPAAHIVEPSVQKLVIYNGPARTVQYFAEDASPQDRQSLRNLERAENEVSLSRQLQTLRNLYISDERALEPLRTAYLARMSTYSPTYATGVYPDEVPPIDTNGTLAFAETYLDYFGAVSPYRRWGAFPFGYGGYGGYGLYPYGGAAPDAGYATSATASAWLPPEESQLKKEIVRTIGVQATPEYSAQAARDLESAVAMAGQSDRLRAGLNLPRTGIQPAGFERTPGSQVVVTLKGGATARGSLVREDPDWVVVNTGNDEVQIRKSEVVSIARPLK